MVNSKEDSFFSSKNDRSIVLDNTDMERRLTELYINVGIFTDSRLMKQILSTDLTIRHLKAAINKGIDPEPNIQSMSELSSKLEEELFQLKGFLSDKLVYEVDPGHSIYDLAISSSKSKNIFYLIYQRTKIKKSINQFYWDLSESKLKHKIGMNLSSTLEEIHKMFVMTNKESFGIKLSESFVLEIFNNVFPELEEKEDAVELHIYKKSVYAPQEGPADFLEVVYEPVNYKLFNETKIKKIINDAYWE